MKNLFDFASENIEDEKSSSYKTNNSKNDCGSDFCNNSNFKNSSNSKEEIQKDAKKLYDKYKNYSENDLLNEFLTTSKSKLKDGSLTKDKIQNTVNSLAPFLNASQKEYLKELIGKLDD